MKNHGCTAQFLTLAIALRISLVEYYARASKIQERTIATGNEELEARRLTIVLLSASLLESCVNAVLSLSLHPEEYKRIERYPTRKKWFDVGSSVTPSFKLERNSHEGRELDFIFECRNAITHAHPEVYSEVANIHPGNHGPWAALTHDRIFSMVCLPVSLLQRLCEGHEPLIASMPSGLAWELRLKDFSPQSQSGSANN